VPLVINLTLAGAAPANRTNDEEVGR
jgi:hypothetical protein